MRRERERCSHPASAEDPDPLLQLHHLFSPLCSAHTPQEVLVKEAVLSTNAGHSWDAVDVCTVVTDPFYFLVKVPVSHKVWTIVVESSRRCLLDTGAPKHSQHHHDQQPRPLGRKSGVSARHHDASEWYRRALRDGGVEGVAEGMAKEGSSSRRYAE